MSEDTKIRGTRTRKAEDGSKLVEGGRFVPMMPTCGQDLMAQWDLPKEAWNGCRLKVGRLIPMSSRYDIVSETTLEDFDLARIAGMHGKGDYQLNLPGSPEKLWGVHTARVSVSAEYATINGYSSMPASEPAPLRLQEARTLRDLGQAATGGQALTPESLAMAIETVVDRAIQRLHVPPASNVDPMDAMFNQFARFQEMQDRLMEGREGAPRTSKSETWADVAKEALPAIAGAIQAIFESRPTPPQPQDIPTLQETPMPRPVINLSEEEKKSVSMAAGMLRPFASHILQVVASRDAGIAAAELAEMIPGPMLGQVERLARLVTERGDDVLAFIDPVLVDPRVSEVLRRITTRMKAKA